MAVFQYRNAEIYYEVKGEGIPVLMIHGYEIDHTFLQSGLEPVFEELDKQFKRYYVDMPGMGKSTAGEIKSSEDICMMFCEFNKEVMQGEAFICVGHSYGGYLARGMVHYLEEKVLGLYLVCSVLDNCRERNVPKKLEVAVRDEEFLMTLSDEMREAYTGMNVKQTGEMYERYVHDIYEALQRADKHFLYDVLETRFDFDILYDKKICEFDGPVMILTGKEDISVGYRDQVFLLDQFKNSTYLAVERAGHHIIMDQPELFHAVTKNWFWDKF